MMDEYENAIGSYSVEVVPRECFLIRSTAKGFWVGHGTEANPWGLRWISNTSKKKYAWPTKKEAMESFVRRTNVMMDHLSRQMNDCRKALAAAERVDTNP